MSLINAFPVSEKQQRSLKGYASLKGIGLFTGLPAKVTIRPASEGTGIVFQRMDLPDKPILSAQFKNVLETPRCTVLGSHQTQVRTVEHLLSALKAYDLDNVLIEIDGLEIPSGDGSALHFVNLIEKVGVLSQSATKTIYHLEDPVFISQNHAHLVALPSDELCISYALHHPNSKLLQSQFYSVLVKEQTYKRDIASARTFSIYEEIAPLIEQGRIKGGSLDNAVVIKEDAVLNPEGLRYRDEMVRHKILDLIGDLSLIGQSFTAHIIAINSGHYLNTLLAKKLANTLKKET